MNTNDSPKKPTLDLRALTPDKRLAAINESVATHVLRCRVEDGMMRLPDVRCDGMAFESFRAIPPFASSITCILPLLEKHPDVEINRVKGDGWQVVIIDRKDYPGGGVIEGIEAEAWEDALALAACIALLRNAGVNVESRD